MSDTTLGYRQRQGTNKSLPNAFIESIRRRKNSKNNLKVNSTGLTNDVREKQFQNDDTNVFVASGYSQTDQNTKYKKTTLMKKLSTPKLLRKGKQVNAVSNENLHSELESPTREESVRPKVTITDHSSQEALTLKSRITNSKSLNPTTPLPRLRKKQFTVQYVRVHGIKDGAYKNESEPRGLIFMKNFEQFDRNEYEVRYGSQNDYVNLLHLFTEIGYKKCAKVCESGHITKKKFMADLTYFSNLDHEFYDSAIFIIMSHGVRDKTFVTSDNKEVDLMEVYHMLNNISCETLKNKPKIFILHFCRPLANNNFPSTMNLPSAVANYNVDEVIERKVRLCFDQLRNELRFDLENMIKEYHFEQGKSTNPPKSADGPPPPLQNSLPPNPDCDERFDIDENYEQEISDRGALDLSNDSAHLCVDAAGMGMRVPSMVLEPLPDYSDMYSIFSTNSGGLALRDNRKGSLLIQSICYVFAKHAFQDDIEELVRKVSKHMQQKLSMDDPLSRHAVVERINNGLDKSFYFNPFVRTHMGRTLTLPGRMGAR